MKEEDKELVYSINEVIDLSTDELEDYLLDVEFDKTNYLLLIRSEMELLKEEIEKIIEK